MALRERYSERGQRPNPELNRTGGTRLQLGGRRRGASGYLVVELKTFQTGRGSHGGAEATDAMRNPGPHDATNLAHYFAQLK